MAGEAITSWQAVYVSSDWKAYKAWQGVTFIWFANASASSGLNVVINLVWLSSSHTGLSEGARYYLNTGIAPNTWPTKANMTTARYGLTSSVVNNKIYCIGWYNGSRLSTNEEYDPSTNTWSTKADMTTGRTELTSSVVNNKIYCIGWYNGSFLNANEEYCVLWDYPWTITTTSNAYYVGTAINATTLFINSPL